MNLVDLYLSYVAPLKGSEKYHRWSIATAISALLERRCWVDKGRLGITFPNLYTLLVGPPATGKTMSADIAVDLVRLVRSESKKPPRISPTKITQAALYKELKDSERRGAYSHLQSPLFIYAPELAVNMTDFGGGTLTNELIDFYDSKGFEAVHEKRIVGDPRTLTLTNPSITLLGCTTDSFLQQASQDKLITSGLSSRITFVVEPERVQKQRDEISIDTTIRQLLIEQLNKIYHTTTQLQLGCKDFYKSLCIAADESCATAQTEFLQNYYGRKPDLLIKLGMIFAIARGDKTISQEDIERAIVWTEELEPNMQKAFGMRNIEKDPIVMESLYKSIPEEPNWISRGNLLANLIFQGKAIPMNGVLEANLRTLKEAALIKTQVVGHDELYSRKKT